MSDTTLTVHPGDAFPAFSLPDQRGVIVTNADLKGKRTVIYFYPKDHTPGCTIEAQQFSAKQKECARKGVQVFAVSVDSVKSHDSFCQKYDLGIRLLSDKEKTLSQALGILKPTGTAARTTFALDERGHIQQIWEAVSPRGHADAVLNEFR